MEEEGRDGGGEIWRAGGYIWGVRVRREKIYIGYKVTHSEGGCVLLQVSYIVLSLGSVGTPCTMNLWFGVCVWVGTVRHRYMLICVMLSVACGDGAGHHRRILGHVNTTHPLFLTLSLSLSFSPSRSEEHTSELQSR